MISPNLFYCHASRYSPCPAFDGANHSQNPYSEGPFAVDDSSFLYKKLRINVEIIRKLCIHHTRHKLHDYQQQTDWRQAFRSWSSYYDIMVTCLGKWLCKICLHGSLPIKKDFHQSIKFCHEGIQIRNSIINLVKLIRSRKTMEKSASWTIRLHITHLAHNQTSSCNGNWSKGSNRTMKFYKCDVCK